MAKGYWIVSHRKPADQAKAGAYREVAVDVVKQAGGKFLVFGGQSEAREFGLSERTVVIEFPSYAKAVETYDSDEYKHALDLLADGAERDFRIVEGAD